MPENRTRSPGAIRSGTRRPAAAASSARVGRSDLATQTTTRTLGVRYYFLPGDPGVPRSVYPFDDFNLLNSVPLQNPFRHRLPAVDPAENCELVIQQRIVHQI